MIPRWSTHGCICAVGLAFLLGCTFGYLIHSKVMLPDEPDCNYVPGIMGRLQVEPPIGGGKFTTQQLQELYPVAVGMICGNKDTGAAMISTGMGKGAWAEYHGFYE